MSHKLHTPKDCPLCDTIIYLFDKHGQPIKLNDKGMTFWVKFNDGSFAEFAICKQCFLSLNQEKIEKIMQDEIYTWGMEIIGHPHSLLETLSQLKWYIETAVHLRIVQYGKTKEELNA